MAVETEMSIREAAEFIDSIGPRVASTPDIDSRFIATGQRVELGRVGDAELIYTVLPHEERVDGRFEQPRTGRVRKQPVLGLVLEGKIRPIAYGADLLNVEPSLRVALVGHLDRRLAPPKGR